MNLPIYLDMESSIATKEITNLHKALYGLEPNFLESPSNDAINISINEIESKVYGNFSIPDKCVFIKRAITIPAVHSIKQFVAHLFLEGLYTNKGNKRLPWGILTGIRPMKLFRKLLLDRCLDDARKILREFYLVSNEKIRLLEQIYNNQQPLLKMVPFDCAVGIYIGIPFCPTKCTYCTFPSFVNSGGDTQQLFFEALMKELDWTIDWLEEHQRTVQAIYVGGGTPSVLTEKQMATLLSKLATIQSKGTIELTFEAGRPDTLTKEKFEVLKHFGVNRISINPQSCNEQTLKRIGRKHSLQSIYDSFELARKIGISHINMDIILGLPGEDLKNVQLTLDKIAELNPESVTIHTLALKSKAKLKDEMSMEEFQRNYQVSEMVSYAEDWAQGHHYKPYYLYRQKNIAGNYENVGYARDGMYSLYNILIMEELIPIIGLGCGAVSKIIHGDTRVIERLANPIDPSHYCQNIIKIVEKKAEILPKILTT